MRATVMYGAGDVRIESVPDAGIIEPTDAVVTVTRACICGSDLWPYKSMEQSETGRPHGARGDRRRRGRRRRRPHAEGGDLVVMPFAYSDGTCVFCHEGLHTSCIHGGFFGTAAVGGAQAEAVRVPLADGTLFVLPVGKDDALMPSLLTLSDVMGTGHHAAVTAEVGPGKTVAVIGDGAVGLCGVIAARRLGAEQIIILGRHPDRIALAREFGATDVVSERGEEAVERVRELTGGFGAHSVLECVGPRTSRCARRSASRARAARSAASAFRRTRRSRPREPAFFNNVTVGGGPAPSARTSRSFCPTSSKARSNPAGSSTGVRPRRGSRRLPGDERAGSDQGHGQA